MWSTIATFLTFTQTRFARTYLTFTLIPRRHSVAPRTGGKKKKPSAQQQAAAAAAAAAQAQVQGQDTAQSPAQGLLQSSPAKAPVAAAAAAPTGNAEAQTFVNLSLLPIHL